MIGTIDHTSGAEELTELAAALQTIGSGSKPRLMGCLLEVSRDHHRELSTALERLPRATVTPVVELVVALTDPTSGLPGTESIHRIARHLGLDPRSYREAARTLSVLAAQVGSNKKLDGLVAKGLQVLNEQGVLGLATIDKVARFLVSVDRRSGYMHRVGPELVVTDDRHDLADWQRLAKELESHDPLWGPRAASLVLYPTVHKGQGSQTLYGGTLVSDHQLPLLKDVLPEETLLVDEPMMVLLPSKSLERDWVRVDPIPKAVVQGQSQAAMYAKASEYFDLDPALERPELLATMQVVYISVLALATVLQDSWLHQVKGVRIWVSARSKSRNFSAYDPKTKTVWITTSSLSAWAVLHELAHAIDDELWDPIGFASTQRGNPLANIAVILRPYYSSAAKKRAGAIWHGMSTTLFPEAMRAEFEKGPVRLDEVISSMPISSELKKTAFDLVVRGGNLNRPRAREKARKRLGMSKARGELLILAALQASTSQSQEGQLEVVYSKLKAAVLEHEITQLLAPPELFARFFSQYVRMYWAQNGWGFGPSFLPGDLDPEVLATLVPSFNDALLRSQLIDQSQLTQWTAGEELKAKIFAAALAAIGLVFSEDLLPG